MLRILLRYGRMKGVRWDREMIERLLQMKLFEDKFTRVDGNPATREHLLMALADLDAFLIKV